MKQPYTQTTFISIVGVILVPLSRFGSVYAWPCCRMAESVCFSYIGCLSAEWLKGKMNCKWPVTIGVAAAIFFGYCSLLLSHTSEDYLAFDNNTGKYIHRRRSYSRLG